MSGMAWTCPYCGHHTTITQPNFSLSVDAIDTAMSKHDRVAIESNAIACPNQQCKELYLTVKLTKQKRDGHGLLQTGAEPVAEWRAPSRSRARPQPTFIPEGIRKDYLEACLILNDGPKASATMSRRCLQGIVRDFWMLPDNRRGNLGAELNFIKDQVDPSTWKVIQTIREVGDIGAHMEKDVNFVVDVELDEANLLIELIETLFADWYVARQMRLDRDGRVEGLAKKKLDEKRDARRNSKTGSDPVRLGGEHRAESSHYCCAEENPRQRPFKVVV